MKKCKCFSNNRPEPWQTDKRVVFRLGDYFPEFESSRDKKIGIDACIAHVIEHLWKNKIWTLGSCCGHNGLFEKAGDRPNIVFEQGLKKKEADKIRRLIAEVDGREFKLLSWILTEV